MVLGKLDLGEDWVKVIDDHDFLALFFHASDFIDGGKGGVDVARPQEVANVEAINLAVTLEVIDIKGEVKSFNFLLLESKFLESGERGKR